jgi:Fe-S cluster biogenesis protein NfuA
MLCFFVQTTMKMGIERVLRERFVALGAIEAVEPASLTPVLTVEAVAQAVEKILPAIQAMGGQLRITGVDSSTGSVEVRFSGPARLKKGVELVLRDNALVQQVHFTDTS